MSSGGRPRRTRVRRQTELFTIVRLHNHLWKQTCSFEIWSCFRFSPPLLLSAENYTLFIKNSVTFPAFGVSRWRRHIYLRRCDECDECVLLWHDYCNFIKQLWPEIFSQWHKFVFYTLQFLLRYLFTFLWCHKNSHNDFIHFSFFCNLWPNETQLWSKQSYTVNSVLLLTLISSASKSNHKSNHSFW